MLRSLKISSSRICESMQGSKGIRQNLFTSSSGIHKSSPFVDYNKWLKRLDTQYNEPTNQNLVKVQK